MLIAASHDKGNPSSEIIIVIGQARDEQIRSFSLAMSSSDPERRGLVSNGQRTQRNPLVQAVWRAHCGVGQVWPETGLRRSSTQSPRPPCGSAGVRLFFNCHHLPGHRVHCYGAYRRPRLHARKFQACGARRLLASEVLSYTTCSPATRHLLDDLRPW